MIKYKKVCFIMLVICLLQMGIIANAKENNGLLQYLETVAQGGPIYEVILDGSGDLRMHIMIFVAL